MGANPLTITAWILAILAVVLAWPAPVLLSRARWVRSAPASAMILWQAIGLAGGLSMIGAFLTWGLSPLGENIYSAIATLVRVVLGLEAPTSTLDIWHTFALSAALLLGAHLLFTLLLTYVRIQRQRKRHRELLLFLSSPSAEQPGTLVISHSAPVAYCLPGGARSVTVLSEGLIELLSEEELRAVLTHESTHLSQRHHLLLWAFAAWKSALPWLPTSKLAQGSVNELIEMLADDAALKVVDEGTLVRSIALVATGGKAQNSSPLHEISAEDSPGVDPSASSDQTTAARVQRLISPPPPLALWKRNLILTGSVLLIAAPTALLVLPSVI